MRGGASEANNRGVSEIYGTVIIISLTFVMAIFLVGIGYYVIGDITSDTEDRISQDSMQELNDRISEVSGSPTNATTAFEFPQGADEIEADDEAGSVEVTVESSRLSADYLKGSDTTERESFDLGTVTFESDDGTVYALQGGGQWEATADNTGMVSPPPFEYDGESLNLGFTSLESAGSLSPGSEATITADADASVDVSKDLAGALTNVWTVQPEGLEPVGSDLVDVTLEIESEFAEGWASYAEDELDEQPTEVSYDEESDTVTIEFEEVGTELPEDVSSTPDDWENDNILYSGNSSHAIFNSVIEPLGSTFVINQSATSNYEHSLDLTDGDKQVYIAIPNPDHPDLSAAATFDGETWETVEAGEDEFTVEDDDLRLFTLENQLTPAFREIETMEPHEFSHAALSAEELFGYSDDIYQYELADAQELCIFVSEEFPGEGEPMPPGNAFGLADYGPDSQTYEQCSMGDVPRESPELEINSVEPVDDDWDDFEPLDEAADDNEIDIEVSVTNNGGMGDANVLLESQIPTPTAETDFLPVDETTVTDINRTETQEVTLTWDPSSSDLADINQSEELDGEAHIRANTGADDSVGGTVDVLYEPPPSEFFEIEVEDAEVKVSGQNASEVESVDTVQDDVEVTVPINNTGETAGEQTVALWYDDGSGESAAATETVEIDTDEEELVEFEWGMDNIALGAETIATAVSTSDDSATLDELDDVLTADFGVGVESIAIDDGQMDVIIEVENRGAAQATQEISMESIDGVYGIDESEEVELAGGESEDVTLSTTAVEGQPGTGELEISSEDRIASTEFDVPEPAIENELGYDSGGESVLPEPDTEWDWSGGEPDLTKGIEEIPAADVVTAHEDADWGIAGIEYDVGDDGWLITNYQTFTFNIEAEHDLTDPANVLATDEDYEVSYEVQMHDQIEGYDGNYDMFGAYDDGDRLPTRNDDTEITVNGANSASGSYTLEVADIEGSRGDNSNDYYVPVEVTIDVTKAGDIIDSDTVIFPVGSPNSEDYVCGGSYC